MTRCRPLGPILLATMVLLSSAVSSGCLVVSLNRFFDESAISSDDRLLGTWRSEDDGITLVIERSEWRSYRISYTHPLESGQLTAYLFKVEGVAYLDLSPQRGLDPGVFLLPAHTMVRVSIAEDALEIRPLSIDWFTAALADHKLPAALAATRAERDQIVLAATPRAMAAWLAARPAPDPAFGAETTLTRTK